MAKKVKDVMVPAVITASPEHTTGRVRELMESHGVHAVPIVGPANQPLGIVTSTDLLSMPSELIPVSRIMTQKLWTLPIDANVTDAARLMREHQLHHVIVIENDVIAGIVSALDLLALVAAAAKKKTRRK